MLEVELVGRGPRRTSGPRVLVATMRHVNGPPLRASVASDSAVLSTVTFGKLTVIVAMSHVAAGTDATQLSEAFVAARGRGSQGRRHVMTQKRRAMRRSKFTSRQRWMSGLIAERA
jgi:hypothetical protein